ATLALGGLLGAWLPNGPGWQIAGWSLAVVAVAAFARVAALRFAAAPAPEADTRRAAALEDRFRARTADLEAARAAAEGGSRGGGGVDRLKSVFIANRSHETRTPLNSVLALSQLLRDGVGGPLTADQRRYLEVIERNGQNLLRLINDIL